MPITPAEASAESYAPLAWNMSIAVLAIEKLLQGISVIQDRERKALATATERIRSLFEASEIPLQDLLQGHVSPSAPGISEAFSTLVAIEEKSAPQPLPSFKQGWEDLSAIQSLIENGETEKIDRVQLERAQEVCLEILEQLNKE